MNTGTATSGQKTWGQKEERRGVGFTTHALWIAGGALLAWLAPLAPAAAQANPASAGAAKLTLERALDIAARRNPDYRQAENNTELNSAEMRAAWFERILPQAQFTLFNTAFYGNNRSRATDNFGNPIERDPVWVYFSNTRQGLSLDWQIQGASLLHTRQSQLLTNRDRVVAADAARLTMTVDVRRKYMDALEQRDLLAAEEALAEARQVDLDLAQRLFSLAMKTRVDVLNAELGIEQQALATRQQRATFEKAKLALRTLLGDEELGAFELVDETLPIFDPSGLDADALVRTALAVNPDLMRAEVGVRQASVAMKQARSAWWPTLSLNLQFTRQAQSNPALTSSTQALFDTSWDEPLDSQFFIQLSFPMFNNFFQNRAEQVKASIDRDNRLEQERAKRLEIEQTVRSALLELANQYENLQVAQRSAEIAAEALRLAREEYRIGTRTFEDLRQAIDQEADTRRQVIEARYSFVDAKLDLEAVVGIEVGPSGASGG